MYYFKYKTWGEGKATESVFFDLIKTYYPNAREATLEEQYKHIDYVCSIGTIDVKGKKRKNRHSNFDMDIVWLEFKSNEGFPGWLYGTQDFIAFERPYGFILVRTPDLLKLGKSLCNLGEKVAKSSEALYKGYTRKGRKDLLSMVSIKDVLTLPYKILHYETDKLI